jgi:hypothetical protein
VGSRVVLDSKSAAKRDIEIPPPPEDEKVEPSSSKKMKKRKNAIAAVVVAAVLITASFTAYLFLFNEKGATNQNQTTLGDNVLFPEDNESVQDVIVANGSITYVYPSAPTGHEFSVGDIIVGEEGHGYLRNITAVQISGNSIVVQTQNASLAEAIESGTINCNQTVDLSTGVNVTVRTPASSLASASIQAEDEYRFPYGDILSNNPEVRISGEIGMIFKIDLHLRFEKHRLSEGKIGVQFNTLLSYELKALGPVVLQELIHVWDKELEIISIPLLSKIPIIGGFLSKLFPLQITPILGFDVDSHVNVQSSALVKGEIYGNYSTGISYNNVTRDWNAFRILQAGYNVVKPNSTAPGEISCSGIFPVLKLMVFDLIGPSIGIQQTQEVSWSLPDGENVTHAVSMGVFLIIGVHVKVFWIELLDYYMPVYGEMRAMTNPEHGVDNW